MMRQRESRREDWDETGIDRFMESRICDFGGG